MISEAEVIEILSKRVGKEGAEAIVKFSMTYIAEKMNDITCVVPVPEI